MATVPARFISPAPNPCVVYYRSPSHSESIAAVLCDNGWTFSEERRQLILECLDIPAEYGDPVLAVTLCIVGYEKHVNRDATMDCVMTDTGELIRLGDALGDDVASRCIPAEFALRDAVEWYCLREGKFPSDKIWSKAREGEILLWAEDHGIRLTEMGFRRLAIMARERELVSCENVQRLITQPTKSPRMYCAKDKSRYTDGWTLALHNELRAKLRKFGFDVPEDLEAVQKIGSFHEARMLGLPAEVTPTTAPDAAGGNGDAVSPQPKAKTGKGGRKRVSEGGKLPKHFETYVEVFPYWERGDTSHVVIAAAINNTHEEDLTLGASDVTDATVRGAFKWLKAKDNADYMRDHVRQKLGKNSGGKAPKKRMP